MTEQLNFPFYVLYSIFITFESHHTLNCAHVCYTCMHVLCQCHYWLCVYSSRRSRVCHVMFHGEGSLNNVLHFFIASVCIHFCSMSSINKLTSWWLNISIKWFLGLILFGERLLYPSVEKIIPQLCGLHHVLYINTFDTATCVACLSPFLIGITGSKKDEEKEKEKEERRRKRRHIQYEQVLYFFCYITL